MEGVVRETREALGGYQRILFFCHQCHITAITSYIIIIITITTITIIIMTKIIFLIQLMILTEMLLVRKYVNAGAR